MKGYEYSVKALNIMSELDSLNEAGKDGWELVSVIPYEGDKKHCIFKKEITIGIDLDGNKSKHLVPDGIKQQDVSKVNQAELDKK